MGDRWANPNVAYLMLDDALRPHATLAHVQRL
jgi:hypothetical protein